MVEYFSGWEYILPTKKIIIFFINTVSALDFTAYVTIGLIYNHFTLQSNIFVPDIGADLVTCVYILSLTLPKFDSSIPRYLSPQFCVLCFLRLQLYIFFISFLPPNSWFSPKRILQAVSVLHLRFPQ